MLSARRGMANSFLVISILFPSYVFLIRLRVWRQLWARVAIVWILVSFLSLEERLHLSLVSIELGIVISQIAFIISRYVSSIPNFIGVFIMREGEFWWRSFLHLFRWSCDFSQHICLIALHHWFAYTGWGKLASLGWNQLELGIYPSNVLSLFWKHFIEMFCICICHGSWFLVPLLLLHLCLVLLLGQ